MWLVTLKWEITSSKLSKSLPNFVFSCKGVPLVVADAGVGKLVAEELVASAQFKVKDLAVGLDLEKQITFRKTIET